MYSFNRYIQLLGYFTILFSFHSQLHNSPHLIGKFINGFCQNPVSLFFYYCIMEKESFFFSITFWAYSNTTLEMLQFIQRLIAHGCIKESFDLMQIEKIVSDLPQFSKGILYDVCRSFFIFSILVCKQTKRHIIFIKNIMELPFIKPNTNKCIRSFCNHQLFIFSILMRK